MNHRIQALNAKLTYILTEAYYGGGVHIFVNKAINMRLYDINSLYPYAMLKDMPTKYIGYVNQVLDISKFNGFVRVKIEILETVNRPLVPIRGPKGIEHPTGTIEGIYYHAEIRL
jgi:DNA polymerase type B, organellar and viral